MAHYLIQTTLAELANATRSVYNPETFEFEKAWQVVAPDRFIGHYANGQAVISGPVVIGNPNKPWFEVQCSRPELVAELGAVGNEMALMKTEMRTNALLRAAYRVENRNLIRNEAGQPVGPLPKFVICGTNPAASYLAGEDPEDAITLPDLEP